MPKTLKDWVETTQALFASVAILAAGGWFMFSGEASDKVNINIEVSRAILTDDVQWIMVRVPIINEGSLEVELEKMEIVIEQLLPVSDEISERLDAGYGLIMADSKRADFEKIAYEESVSQEVVTIRPTELDAFYFEFGLPREVELIRVSVFAPIPSSKKGQGWRHAVVVNLNKL